MWRFETLFRAGSIAESQLSNLGSSRSSKTTEFVQNPLTSGPTMPDFPASGASVLRPPDRGLSPPVVLVRRSAAPPPGRLTSNHPGCRVGVPLSRRFTQDTMGSTG